MIAAMVVFFSELLELADESTYNPYLDDSWTCYKGSLAAQPGVTSGFFVQVLKAATRLQVLSISHAPSNAPAPSIRVPAACGVHILRLKRLRLEQLGTRAEDLVPLLQRHRDTLEEVVLIAIIPTART
jgi:hypothetical protein